MSTPSLPVAAPEEIGLSAARLTRLGDVLRGEIDRGRVPGAVALIARRGKLGYFEALGARDPVSAAPQSGCQRFAGRLTGPGPVEIVAFD